MAQEILQFSNQDRVMAGALTLPDRGDSGVGFVLCRPFGAEAIRSHAMFRALATRLARAGCATLVFDYHGTGESPGDAATQDLAHWQRDIVAADAFLRYRTGVARTHWFGLGLGATLAARAALAAPAAARPAHLVLWDPVENGSDYVALMFARHRREMERWFRSRWDVIRRDGLEDEPSLPGVVLGFEVGSGLAADFGRLQTLQLQSLIDAGIRVTIGRDRAATAALPSSPLLRVRTIEQKINWMTNHAPEGEEYEGSAIVPQDAVAAAQESLHVVELAA
ncbi:MAG TPA: alpha/beta fold hydrolase [Burkholderiaceae bacterium]|nr:alpha/beta fold hydrolase [Burkholderiaceae bacterium]